jgi:hypothetical protein
MLVQGVYGFFVVIHLVLAFVGVYQAILAKTLDSKEDTDTTGGLHKGE